MDSICLGCYACTDYTNVSGYNRVNTLFFKKSKFVYVGTTGIYTADPNISDINMHTLYYISPDLATTKDTIYLNVIVVHDASGATSDATRTTEIGGAMTWLSAHVTKPGNYIFMGDFNTQSGSDGSFQAMINPTDTMVKFNDPPNQVGDWANKPSVFAKYLTQSTRRVDPGDCASTNTMTARFDHILCTNPIMKGTAHARYIPGSFEVIGQDGLHTKVAINDAPTNTSVPVNVLDALYNMSEHLPVKLKLEISGGNPLPIGFNYFKVTLQNNEPHLQWNNNNNNQAISYEVERSKDGIVFTNLSITYPTSNNLTSYDYLDASFAGNNMVYYRIKQHLKTGGYLYSNIASIRLVKTISAMSISPNPVRNTLTLSLQSDLNNTATISILNNVGKSCFTKNTTLQTGANSITIDQLDHLAKGTYIIKVQTNNHVESKLFIKSE